MWIIREYLSPGTVKHDKGDNMGNADCREQELLTRKTQGTLLSLRHGSQVEGGKEEEREHKKKR